MPAGSSREGTLAEERARCTISLSAAIIVFIITFIKLYFTLIYIHCNLFIVFFILYIYINIADFLYIYFYYYIYCQKNYSFYLLIFGLFLYLLYIYINYVPRFLGICAFYIGIPKKRAIRMARFL